MINPKDKKKTRAEEIRSEHLDSSTKARLDYRKEQREVEAKRAELQRRKMDILSIAKQIDFKKTRLQEIQYVLRRLQTEFAHAEAVFQKEKNEERGSSKNLEEEQRELEESTREIDEKLKELASEIEKKKKEIMEHERKLQELDKKDKDLLRQKDKQSGYRKGVVSRLISIAEREKEEVQKAQTNKENLSNKQRVLNQESSNLKAEITILENKLKALMRNMSNY